MPDDYESDIYEDIADPDFVDNRTNERYEMQLANGSSKASAEVTLDVNELRVKPYASDNMLKGSGKSKPVTCNPSDADDGYLEPHTVSSRNTSLDEETQGSTQGSAVSLPDENLDYSQVPNDVYRNEDTTQDVYYSQVPEDMQEQTKKTSEQNQERVYYSQVPDERGTEVQSHGTLYYSQVPNEAGNQVRNRGIDYYSKVSKKPETEEQGLGTVDNAYYSDVPTDIYNEVVFENTERANKTSDSEASSQCEWLEEDLRYDTTTTKTFHGFTKNEYNSLPLGRGSDGYNVSHTNGGQYPEANGLYSSASDGSVC